MSARPICPGFREGTGCHSDLGAEIKQPSTKRPKQRLANAPARQLVPRDAPPLVTSRASARLSPRPPGPGEGNRRGGERPATAEQPPSLLPRAVTADPAPFAFQSAVGSAPPSSSFGRSRAASSLPCLVFLLQTSCTHSQSLGFLAFFPSEVIPPSLPFSLAVRGTVVVFRTQ